MHPHFDAHGIATEETPPGRPSPRTRILAVEDDADIAQLLRHSLQRAGDIEVEVALSGDVALQRAHETPPDLILLDLNLPNLSGFDVCRGLRSRPATKDVPIIMLTARSTEADRVSGLDLGADDYITKPFSLRELSARIRAVLRRRQGVPVPTGISLYRGATLTADFDAVSVAVQGRPVRLTRREFELLRCLVENRNRVLTRNRLLERIWGYGENVETRSVDVHVGRLRSKLGPAGRHVETVVGIGYRFVEEPAAAAGSGEETAGHADQRVNARRPTAGPRR